MKPLINKTIGLMKKYCPPIENRRLFNGLLLDFNEALIPISPRVKKTLINFIRLNTLHMYPEYGEVNKKISLYSDCEEDQILITNGSDQGIDIIFKLFTSQNDQIIIPSPSFAMFYQRAELNQTKIITPKYTETGDFPLEEVVKSINKKTKLIVICNPNNPTGTIVETAIIEKILQKASIFGAMVYVDEAYYEFSQITAVKLLENYNNIIITRTFSKAFGLAALRIGYIIARKEIINEMIKIRSPYDVNMLAAVCATAALDDYKAMQKYRDEIMQKSKPLLEEFLVKNNIFFLKSNANFILFKVDNPHEIFKNLKESGFLLRLRDFNEEIFIRVTLGTLKQTKEFITAFKNLILQK